MKPKTEKEKSCNISWRYISNITISSLVFKFLGYLAVRTLNWICFPPYHFCCIYISQMFFQPLAFWGLERLLVINLVFSFMVVYKSQFLERDPFYFLLVLLLRHSNTIVISVPYQFPLKPFKNLTFTLSFYVTFHLMCF